MRQLKYAEAILEATDQILSSDQRAYVIGLGCPDPKGIFGTTLGLLQKFGPKRVMDMPVSENAMMGVVVGSALAGMRPIMTHQRVDFFLLALDQLINNAAKWHYMFGGQMQVPLVVRLVMGRGWGQGPQHSQTMQALFAHIPGLKVVMPSTPQDAKGLLISAFLDPNPVIYLEHRWLHDTIGDVPEEFYSIPIGSARVVKEGSDITVVALSHMVLESARTAIALEGHISLEVIDLRSLRPWDKETVLASVRKTGRLLVADPDWKTGGFAAEIIASVCEEAGMDLKANPKRVTYPDAWSPTGWALANHFFPTAQDIEASCWQLMGNEHKARDLLKQLLANRKSRPMDTPDPAFKGPF